MAFTNMKLTTFGSNIEAKCHQGKGLHFTRIAVGDGLLGNGSMINRTGLVSERHSMQIDGIIATENATQSAVIATLDNSVFTEGFYYRELALFAKDPDTDQEGVYLYDNAGQECEFLGLREDGVVIYERIKMLIRVEQTSQISFDGSGNPLYMSPEDVIELIEQHNVSEDAHKTKADLGKDGLLKDSQRPKADGLYMPDGKKISDKINGIEAAMLLALAAAAPYSTSQTYALGAYCTRGGKLYKANQAISAAEDWTAAHWTETTMGAELVAIYTTLANNDPKKWGLGIVLAHTPGTVITDFDEILPTGFYYVQSGSLNRPINGAVYAVVINRSYDDVTVFAESPDGVIARRKYKESWGVWEYINPPMNVGYEFRTTERYNGKPVYVKSIDLGVLPSNSSKEVSIGVDNIENVISVSGTSSNGFAFPVPLHGSDGSIDVIVSRASIKVITYATQTISSVAVIKYTKTTD